MKTKRFQVWFSEFGRMKSEFVNAYNGQDAIDRLRKSGRKMMVARLVK